MKKLSILFGTLTLVVCLSMIPVQDPPVPGYAEMVGTWEGKTPNGNTVRQIIYPDHKTVFIAGSDTMGKINGSVTKIEYAGDGPPMKADLVLYVTEKVERFRTPFIFKFHTADTLIIGMGSDPAARPASFEDITDSKKIQVYWRVKE